MEAVVEKQYIFYRQNNGAAKGEVASRLSEKEVRVYIGASVGNVDRAIKRLKEGKSLHTRFATYTAEVIKKNV